MKILLKLNHIAIINETYFFHSETQIQTQKSTPILINSIPYD